MKINPFLICIISCDMQVSSICVRCDLVEPVCHLWLRWPIFTLVWIGVRHCTSPLTNYWANLHQVFFHVAVRIVGDIVEGIVQMMIQVWNFAKRFIKTCYWKRNCWQQKVIFFPRWPPEILKTWSLLTCQKFELIKTWYKIILEVKF